MVNAWPPPPYADQPPFSTNGGRFWPQIEVGVYVPRLEEVVALARTGALFPASGIARAKAATFQVRTASGEGSAFYIGNDEWLTSHHVVEGAARVELAHGGVRLATAVDTLLPWCDLALLRAQPPDWVPYLSLARARPTNLASVAVVGFPSGVSGTPSTTCGVVLRHVPFSDFPRKFNSNGVLLQTNADMTFGNSGGPIVDDRGAVVGIAAFEQFVSRGQRIEREFGFGVAAETIAIWLTLRRIARELRAHGTLSQLETRGEAVRDERAGRFCARSDRNSP